MKVVVVGRSGQIARALARRGVERGFCVETLGRPEFDLEGDDFSSIADARADVVINAAAFTAVDGAESEPERAYRVNAGAAGEVARAAALAGAALVHVSTDYVFAGDKPAPYVEGDATGPTGVYGASKLEGERLALAGNPRSVVLRTAWVFDAYGANFVRTMLRLARRRASINVVADQQGCPTYAPDFADAALLVAAALAQGREQFGVYHCAGAGTASWADFATETFARSAALGGPAAAVVPTTTADYPTPAKRPSNSRLDCAKLALDYGIRLRPWTESLAACVEEIRAGGWSVG